MPKAAKRPGLTQALAGMGKDIALNDFATRSFRDTADCDYIHARTAFRADLTEQFYWSCQQAIEKYLKAILLYNEIPATDVGHSVEKALNLCKKLPFSLDLTERCIEFIKEVDEVGMYRYLEVSYSLYGPKLIELDQTVWNLRLYCRDINYSFDNGAGKAIDNLPYALKEIQAARESKPHKFKGIGGELERIKNNKRHAARQHLLWQNFYYASRARKSVRMQSPLRIKNAPLFLDPTLIEKIPKYVYFPKGLLAAYKQLHAS